MARIVLENLSKIYPGGFKAVDNASLEIAEGEFLVLVGPSGCGKSTTLRMIAGLDDISSGSITIDGKRVNDVPSKDRDIAMVFQNYALYPHMTAYKNMAFGLMLRKRPADEIDARVREAARILGITDEQLQRKPGALSGGQRQRVAVGRAIVRQPKAFLFDEPLSNLDAKMRVEMRAELSKLHSRLGSTMIYVTHDQAEAMTMGDRIVVMKDGVIQQVDTPLALYDNPTNMFVAGFIGSPPMNFFRGHVERRDNRLWFLEGEAGGTRGFALPIDDTSLRVGQGIALGCRPENVILRPGAPIAQATVEVIEPMGAETHVYLTTGMHSFVARLHTREQLAVGETVPVAFDLSRCRWFDAATEASLANGR
ncbi:MAG TPA: ABC transporter ATP-binding protein [Terriglobia bacterium]|nr:ABC transporter ATP-binding protein [Terriglobia bacterium]